MTPKRVIGQPGLQLLQRAAVALKEQVQEEATRRVSKRLEYLVVVRHHSTIGDHMVTSSTRAAAFPEFRETCPAFGGRVSVVGVKDCHDRELQSGAASAQRAGKSAPEARTRGASSPRARYALNPPATRAAVTLEPSPPLAEPILPVRRDSGMLLGQKHTRPRHGSAGEQASGNELPGCQARSDGSGASAPPSGSGFTAPCGLRGADDRQR